MIQINFVISTFHMCVCKVCSIIPCNGMNSHIVGNGYNTFHDFLLFHFVCMCYFVVSLSFLDSIFLRRWLAQSMMMVVYTECVCVCVRARARVSAHAHKHECKYKHAGIRMECERIIFCTIQPTPTGLISARHCLKCWKNPTVKTRLRFLPSEAYAL